MFDYRWRYFDFYMFATTAILMGFGLPGENAHAPNEWMSVRNFEKGILTAAIFHDEFAARYKR